MASAAVASVPRVAAARCICSWRPPAASAIDMICAWLTDTVAAKESRSSPSQRDASGVPSRISLETSRPMPTSRALHSTLPSRSWRSSMARPSSNTRPASTSHTSESHGRCCAPIAASAAVARPRPRRSPVRASRSAACQVDLPDSLGPVTTVIPGARSSRSPWNGPNARATTCVTRISGHLEVAASLERTQAGEQHPAAKVRVFDPGRRAGELTAHGGLALDLEHVVSSREIADANHQPVQVLASPAQPGQVDLEAGRHLTIQGQPDEPGPPGECLRDRPRHLLRVAGSVQGDGQVLDLGDGDGAPLTVHRSIGPQGGEDGPAVPRLAELERV